eukprot:1159412-Pelagomonas_calceolata.AAC.5
MGLLAFQRCEEPASVAMPGSRACKRDEAGKWCRRWGYRGSAECQGLKADVKTTTRWCFPLAQTTHPLPPALSPACIPVPALGLQDVALAAGEVGVVGGEGVEGLAHMLSAACAERKPSCLLPGCYLKAFCCSQG